MLRSRAADLDPTPLPIARVERYEMLKITDKQKLIERINQTLITSLTDPPQAFADLIDPAVVWGNYLPAHVSFGAR